jgi:hypothetical protein
MVNEIVRDEWLKQKANDSKGFDTNLIGCAAKPRLTYCRRVEKARAIFACSIKWFCSFFHVFGIGPKSKNCFHQNESRACSVARNDPRQASLHSKSVKMKRKKDAHFPRTLKVSSFCNALHDNELGMYTEFLEEVEWRSD